MRWCVLSLLLLVASSSGQETTKQAADDNTTAEKSGTTTPTEKSSETSLAKTSTEKAETPAAKSTTEKAETSPAKITTEKAETRPVKTSPAETLEVRRENSANKENTAKTTLEPTTHAFDGFVPDFEEKRCGTCTENSFYNEDLCGNSCLAASKAFTYEEVEGCKVARLLAQDNSYVAWGPTPLMIDKMLDGVLFKTRYELICNESGEWVLRDHELDERVEALFVLP